MDCDRRDLVVSPWKSQGIDEALVAPQSTCRSFAPLRVKRGRSIGSIRRSRTSLCEWSRGPIIRPYMIGRMRHSQRGKRFVWFAILACIGGLVVIFVLVVLAPTWLVAGLVRGGSLTTQQWTTDVADERKSMLWIVGGIVASLGLLYTALRHQLERDANRTDRYASAIGQLGNKNLDVRLGGIYALERIAQDSVRDRAPIGDVLAAYVREHTRERDNRPAFESPSTDVQAALTVLARRPYEPSYPPANLGRAVMTRALLNNANLRGALLPYAELTKADITHSHLERSNLARSTLIEADFRGANLDYADLTGANLSGANLDGASLIGAKLRSANLTGSSFQNANLTEGNLQSADLTGANLLGADLSRSNLTRANFQLARLVMGGDYFPAEAKFREADVKDAQFSEGSSVRHLLSEDQLKSVVLRGDGPEPDVTLRARTSSN